MKNEAKPVKVHQEALFVIALGWYVILGCCALVTTILIADFIVPNHDWIADTISDLGAGKYEFIVDIGLYAFASSLISIALLSAHVHMGSRGWTFGIVGFAILGLLVFLIGARDEYGDNDSEGFVIHTYLVYILGFLMATLPYAMAKGASRVKHSYGKILKGISILWIISAPVFFFLPSSIDGIYERYLGLIAIGAVCLMARIFIQYGNKLR